MGDRRPRGRRRRSTPAARSAAAAPPARYHSAALASNALHFASDLAGSSPSWSASCSWRRRAAGGRRRGPVRRRARHHRRDPARPPVDRRPHGPRDVAEAEEAVRGRAGALGDIELRRVRVRHAGGRDFVDLVIAVRADTGVGQAHTAADEVEAAVRRRAAGTPTSLVHVEPRAAEGGLRERATAAALERARRARGPQRPRDPHGRRLRALAAREAPGELDLGTRTPSISAGGTIQTAVPELRRIHTHIEPLAGPTGRCGRPRGRGRRARAVIEDVVRRTPARAPERVSASATPIGAASR